jgi:hypothetical protein
MAINNMKRKKALVEYCLNGFINVYNDIAIKLIA